MSDHEHDQHADRRRAAGCRTRPRARGTAHREGRHHSRGRARGDRLAGVEDAGRRCAARRARVDQPRLPRAPARRRARAAALELGIDPGPAPVIVAVENTDRVHHMVVCTLCSCYPRRLLGPPPYWYKSLPYRSRAVSDPRGVLAEFGVALDDDVELRVLDSTADIRYLVIPRRPAGSEAMSEDGLAALVTRDAMIGVAQPVAPAAVAS